MLGAPPDEFMFYRVLALHLHISFYTRRRAAAAAASAAAARPPPTFAGGGGGASAPDVAARAAAEERRRLTQLWGSINLQGAARFERRLRLYPFVALTKRWGDSAFASRRLPYPASLILPEPRGAGGAAGAAATGARAPERRSTVTMSQETSSAEGDARGLGPSAVAARRVSTSASRSVPAATACRSP